MHVAELSVRAVELALADTLRSPITRRVGSGLLLTLYCAFFAGPDRRQPRGVDISDGDT